MELLLMHKWAGFAATDSAGLFLEAVVCRRVIDQIHLTPVYEMSQNVPGSSHKKNMGSAV
jgi:hypothetical protein